MRLRLGFLVILKYYVSDAIISWGSAYWVMGKIYTKLRGMNTLFITQLRRHKIGGKKMPGYLKEGSVHDLKKEGP